MVMKFSKKFHIIYEENSACSSFGSYILFEDFYQYLKKSDTSLKKFNLRRSLSNLKERTNHLNGQETVKVRSVLKYCFSRCDNSEVCNNIVKDIENELLGTSEKNIKTSLELYKLITNSDLLSSYQLFNQLEFCESDISTLVIEHKTKFSQEEWKKVCWFEHHFAKHYSECLQDVSYEELVDLKFSKFESLNSVKERTKTLVKTSRSYCAETSTRLGKTSDQHEIKIRCFKQHVPYIIEEEISCIVKDYTSIEKCDVACFDVSSSLTSNIIWVAIGTNSENVKGDVDGLCKVILYRVYRRHEVVIDQINFLDEEIFSRYSEDDLSARFRLRDDLENHVLGRNLETWDTQNINTEELCAPLKKDEGLNCETCSKACLYKPLSIGTFDILQEWYLSVPCETQILFESFINKRSLKRVSEPIKFQKQKLQKLYGIYETLLNLLNRKFLGVFQQSNSNELLIEFKSVNSVFDITSSSGITASLKSAERSLKKYANPDLCYYNTYLKQQPLQYKSNTGHILQNVSLRECHLILMLDNLVRLTYVADPNPGEHRSKQICTIPITLQGLPIDSEVTRLWHLEGCNGSSTCSCKKEKILTPKEIQDVLLKPQNNEEKVYGAFEKLMTWGNVHLWPQLTDYVLEDSPTIDQQNVPTKETDIWEDDDGEDSLLQLINAGTNDSICEENCELTDESFSDDDMSVLEQSFDEMSLLEAEALEQRFDYIQALLSAFGFTKFMVPPLLTRHPPPASGRDDDIGKIQEILDDVIVKMGYSANQTKMVNRILCGPDQKIGNCLLRLMSTNNAYKVFLPEFPLLHLRKSKITTLFSAYKDAGIIQLLKFMRKDDQDDWVKLVSIQHIDVATRFVRRIAISLHLAFLVKFSQRLDALELESFLHDMEVNGPEGLSLQWHKKYLDFLEFGKAQNATFSLHVDIMKHCDNVVAIALSERLGGCSGYELLLSAVKQSLLFSYVNNASSYAPYCTQLLYYHYTAGHFHQHMKYTLYTTPLKGSTRNFACDTKREMDHLDAIKGFRSGSNITSVSCRLSLMDSLNEAHSSRLSKTGVNSDEDRLGWSLTEVDINHIIPTTELILRMNGLSIEMNDTPFNMYSKVALALPKYILDRASTDVGKYLMIRYMSANPIFNITKDDLPDISELNASQELINKAVKGKSITIKRALKGRTKVVQSKKDIEEECRKKNVEKEMKLVNCLSSANNACQAWVKPDSSKPKVLKSIGIQRALKNLISSCIGQNVSDHELTCYLQINMPFIPYQIQENMKLCTVEFAGMKFKATAIKSGREYIKMVETYINSLTKKATCLSTLIICEEKYAFTPDIFKQETRKQRIHAKDTDIHHLTSRKSFLNDNIFNSDTITKTPFGKSAISTYLAEKITDLNLERNFELVVDSELIFTCECKLQDACSCKKYAVPISMTNGVVRHINIKQRKGEGEMAVVDWLVHYKDKVSENDLLACIVTSGDIDAVYIHLYAVSKYWPKINGKFSNQIYVILQKPHLKYDIYNITAILELLQGHYKDEMIGFKVAMALCMGGNDFLPKCFGLSHDTILQTIIGQGFFRKNLFGFNEQNIILNESCFMELYKNLYCPKRYKNSNLTFQEVRALSIGKRNDESKRSGYAVTDPRKWLPPESAISRLAKTIQLQASYLETCGKHEADLPNFLRNACFQKNDDGEIFYDFGPESFFQTMSELPDVSEKVYHSRKRNTDNTPQQGLRRKFRLTSTPKKS